MELWCFALLLTLIVSSVSASPYGYGVKGGAFAQADVAAAAGSVGAFNGVRHVPLISAPLVTGGYTGSFTKSSSSSFASSSSSASSGLFSYSGIGPAGYAGSTSNGFTGGNQDCSIVPCDTKSVVAPSTELSSSDQDSFVSSSANAAAIAGIANFGSSSVYDNGGNSDCTGDCLKNPTSSCEGSYCQSTNKEEKCTSGTCNPKTNTLSSQETSKVKPIYEPSVEEPGSENIDSKRYYSTSQQCTQGKCELPNNSESTTSETFSDSEPETKPATPSEQYSSVTNTQQGSTIHSKTSVPERNLQPPCESPHCGKTYANPYATAPDETNSSPSGKPKPTYLSPEETSVSPSKCTTSSCHLPSSYDVPTYPASITGEPTSTCLSGNCNENNPSSLHTSDVSYSNTHVNANAESNGSITASETDDIDISKVFRPKPSDGANNCLTGSCSTVPSSTIFNSKERGYYQGVPNKHISSDSDSSSYNSFYPSGSYNKQPVFSLPSISMTDTTKTPTIIQKPVPAVSGLETLRPTPFSQGTSKPLINTFNYETNGPEVAHGYIQVPFQHNPTVQTSSSSNSQGSLISTNSGYVASMHGFPIHNSGVSSSGYNKNISPSQNTGEPFSQVQGHTSCGTSSCQYSGANIRPAQITHTDNSHTIKPPVYTGSFGGAAGFLKPNDFAVPSKLGYGIHGSTAQTNILSTPLVSPSLPIKTPFQPAVVTKVPISSGHSTCDNGACSYDSAKPVEVFHSKNPVGGVNIGAVASSNAVVYTGGFGGPPGLLKPYDSNSRIDLGHKNYDGKLPTTQTIVPSGIFSETGVLSGSTAQSSSISAVNDNSGNFNSQNNNEDSQTGNCKNGCVGTGGNNYDNNYGLSGVVHGGVSNNYGFGNAASTVAKGSAGAIAGAYGGSYSSSSASAYASSVSGIKGGYGR